MQKFDYEQFFPFEHIRNEQRKAIEFVLDSFLVQKKKLVVLDLGVGVGKSATGVCVARYLASMPEAVLASDRNAYVLTTQKILQQQYINDFGPGLGRSKNLLLTIKSSSNYTCLHYTNQSCAESRRILNKLNKQLVGTEFHTCCKGGCPYTIDKRAFIESPIGVTNFSYFLSETMYAHQLGPRGLLVIDEAHNIENELSKHIEVTFSEKFARDMLKCKPPKVIEQESIIDWINKSYKPALVKNINKLEKAFKANFSSGITPLDEHTKQYEKLDKHVCKVNRFLETYSPENWVMNLIKPTSNNRRAGDKYEFKPIDVSRYGNDFLFKYGDRVLMMSATIVDKDVFCSSIGINPDEVAFLKIESPFPIENRPIHYLPVGSMSMNNINSTLPAMAETVGMLLKQHPNEKGIIHATNYKIAQYLKDNVRTDRLLIHNSENRDSTLQAHISGNAPTVLLSPSMMEGVDLADDASRFQILCKVPFPFLGNTATKKRMEKNPKWYDYQTAKSVIQAFGRSIRNERDHATSYILDSDWKRFYVRNTSMFPSDFSKALV